MRFEKGKLFGLKKGVGRDRFSLLEAELRPTKEKRGFKALERDCVRKRQEGRR